MIDLPSSLALGLAVVVVLLILYWVLGRFNRAIVVSLSAIVELFLSASLILIFQGIISSVGISLFFQVYRKLESISLALADNLNKIIGAAVAVAFLDLILGIVLAGAGGGEAFSILPAFQNSMHPILSFLDVLAFHVGTLMLLSKLLLKLSTLFQLFFNLLLSLTPLQLIPRVRKVTLPLWLFLLVFSVMLPLSISNVPEMQTLDIPLLIQPKSLGFIRFHVVERSGSPIYRPAILVGLRGENGSFYVLKVREEALLSLPTGVYTAVWVADYWTNFTINGCCYVNQTKSGGYCNCWVSPSLFRIYDQSTTTVVVTLPVDIIENYEGHTGHVIAFVGDNVIHPEKGDGYVDFQFDPKDLEKGVEISVRGGSYNLSLLDKNATQCQVHLIRGTEKPPGELLDLSWYGRALREYDNWLSRVENGIPESFLHIFRVRGTGAPSFDEYTIHLSTSKCNSTSPVPVVKVRVYGNGMWNESNCPVYISGWTIIRQVLGSVLVSTWNIIEPLVILYAALFSTIVTGAGVLSLAGVHDNPLLSLLKQSISKPRSSHTPPLRLFALPARLKRSKGGIIRIEIFTPEGRLVLKPSSHGGSRRIVEGLNESPATFVLRALSEKTRDKHLRSMYRAAKYGLRGFEGKIRSNLYKKLVSSTFLAQIKISSLLGYHVYTRKQLNVRDSDSLLKALKPEVADALLRKYKEVVAEDLVKLSKDFSSEYLKKIEESDSLDKIDLVLSLLFFREPEFLDKIFKANRIYAASEGLKLASLQLYYRLKALERVEGIDTATLRLSKEIYLDRKKAVRDLIGERGKWGIIYGKIRDMKNE